MAYTNNDPNNFLNRVKMIPILDVCNFLGVEWKEQGGNKWCKVRPERTASALIRDDLNMYVDFGGTGKRSDVIQLVCDVKGMDRKDAIRYLADAFNIRSERQTTSKYQSQNDSKLAFWEYEKIGLSGDLATKNFTFDFEKQGIERIEEISSKYAMPMNDLRQKHPKVYEQLMWDQAIPYVQDLRNNYYLSIINLHHVLNITDFTQYPDLKKSLASDAEALRDAEYVLKRALAKTSIGAQEVGQYEPETDLKKLLAGEIRPSIGNQTKNQLASAAQNRKCEVWHKTIPWDKYFSRGLDQFPYSAYIKGDSVLLSYLSADYKQMKPLLDKMVGKPMLQDSIANAESKRQSHSYGAGTKTMQAPER